MEVNTMPLSDEEKRQILIQEEKERIIEEEKKENLIQIRQQIKDSPEEMYVFDYSENANVILRGENIYQPVLPRSESAHSITSFLELGALNGLKQIEFKDTPKTEWELGMWNTLKTFEEQAWAGDNKGLTTGFPTLDKAFDGGLFPGFYIIGGESNSGKSAYLSQIGINIATKNDNVYVMDFSLDDPMKDKVSRIGAILAGIPINCFKTPQNFMNYPLMISRRREIMADMYALVDRYRCYDSQFTSFSEEIEEEVKNKIALFKAEGKGRKVVVLIDNFHDLNLKEGTFNDKQKYDELAQFCSNLAIDYDIPVICTGEFRKMDANKRPSPDCLRESVKIKYEAKAILLVYNEMHYKGDNAACKYVNPDGTYGPIFEVQIAKNKFGSFKGRLFYKFHPELAFMEECDRITSMGLLRQVKE